MRMCCRLSYSLGQTLAQFLRDILTKRRESKYLLETKCNSPSCVLNLNTIHRMAAFKMAIANETK